MVIAIYDLEKAIVELGIVTASPVETILIVMN